MNKILLVLMILLACTGCKNDAWGGGDSKGGNAKDYKIIDEIKDHDGFFVGHHATIIPEKLQKKGTVAYMKVTLNQADARCKNKRSETLKSETEVKWNWSLCQGYNSAQSKRWIMRGNKRIDLPGKLLEKTIE